MEHQTISPWVSQEKSYVSSWVVVVVVMGFAVALCGEVWGKGMSERPWEEERYRTGVFL